MICHNCENCIDDYTEKPYCIAWQMSLINAYIDDCDEYMPRLCGAEQEEQGGLS